MRSAYFLLAGLLMLGSSCKKESDAFASEDFIGRDWFNTFEQTTSGAFTYTPTARAQGWRYDGFRLEANGEFAEYGLGPADGPQTRPGTWTALGNARYQIRFTAPQLQGYILHIESVRGGVLTARKE